MQFISSIGYLNFWRLPFSIIVVLLLLLNSSEITAQSNFGNSPYSRFGLGIVQPFGTTRNFAMANTGIALPHYDFLNLRNPALTVYNRQSCIDFALNFQSRDIYDQSGLQSFRGLNIAYMGLAFPVGKKFSATIGLTPHTIVDYSVNSEQLVSGDTNKVLTTYKGDGGLNKFFLNIGYNLGKGFAIGTEVSYLFGTNNQTQAMQLLPAGTNFVSELKTSYRVNDFLLKPGINYRKNIDTKKREFINIGAYASIGNQLNAVGQQTLSRQRFANLAPYIDTFYYNRNIVFDYPYGFGIGLGYEKLLAFSVALDFEYEQWSKYAQDGQQQGLGDRYRVSAGTEFVPSSSAQGYFNYITYRAGVFAEQLPILIESNAVNDIGINFGASFPIVSKSTGRFARPYVNVGFGYAKRIAPVTGYLTEDIFQMQLSFTFNDNRWFQKAKVD